MADLKAIAETLIKGKAPEVKQLVLIRCKHSGFQVWF